MSAVMDEGIYENMTERNNVLRAIYRYYEIKRTVAELNKESALIVQYLDGFDEDLLKECGVKRKPVTNTKVDADIAAELMNGNGHLQEVGESLFRYKAELNRKSWNALSAEDRLAFAPAITESAGKTSYECKAAEELTDEV